MRRGEEGGGGREPQQIELEWGWNSLCARVMDLWGAGDACCEDGPKQLRLRHDSPFRILVLCGQEGYKNVHRWRWRNTTFPRHSG